MARREWAIIDRSINEATREAIRAFADIYDEFRRKVAAALSHDMPPPLAVIGYGAQLIARAQDLDAPRAAALKIESHSARLKNMMGELGDSLTFRGGAKIPILLAPFNMLKLSEEICDQYALIPGQAERMRVGGESVSEHRTRERCAAPSKIWSTTPSNTATVARSKVMVQHTRGRLMLTVHNEGAPIPESQHNRIFELLRRDGQTFSTKRWGVRLPFVEAMAEAHGGSVSADSGPGMGMTFLIDVPVDCRPYVDSPASESSEPSPSARATSMAG